MSISVIADPSGEWMAVVANSAVLAIEAQASDRLGELHAAMRSDDATRAVLAQLVSRGLDDLPAFALVSVREGEPAVRVVVRGPIVVSSGSETVSGSDVATWTERVLAAGSEVRIATPAFGRGAALPLADGAVWAAEIVLHADGTPSPEPSPSTATAPATTALPVAAAEMPAARIPIEEHTIAEPQDEGVGYDHLFEATVIRSVEEAAVRPEAAVDDVDESAPRGQSEAADDGGDDDHDDDGGDGDDGDHDGMTVFSDRLGDVKGRAKPHPSEIVEADVAPTFWVRMPDGSREPLTGQLLVGRAPTTRVGDGPVPRLVTLTNDPDISRTHVKFSLEGDTVVVTDLHSRNGTTVLLPGKSPQLLRAGESTTVIADTVVDLGGGTKMTVEQDPS